MHRVKGFPEDQLSIETCSLANTVINTAITENGKASIGLSGGSLSSLITSNVSLFKFNSNLVHFFYCDERIVPNDSSDLTHNSYKDFYRALDVPASNIHTVDTSLSVKDAATSYQDNIFSYFDISEGFPCFDLLLLGIGPDGHTCSLFPNHKLLPCEDSAVAPITDSPKPPPGRVTLTLPVLNKARNVIFVVSGAGKADIMQKIFTSSAPTADLPCTLVRPIDGQLYWYADEAAVSKLHK